MTDESWIRDFSLLALRTEQRAGADGIFSTLIYTGPASWRDEIVASAPLNVGDLLAECERLLGSVPLPGARSALWGVWANAAIMAAGGASPDELGAPWLDGPATSERLRRLLTEPVLPADVAESDGSAT